MLKHGDIWRAIDRLAQVKQLSASGLAKTAGLDPTTFNKSKRVTAGGKLRWPSTESIAKVLEATSTTFGEFVGLISDGTAPTSVQRVPVIGYAQAGNQGFFDDAGFPVGGGWDEIPFPNLGDPHAYALEVSGDSMEPVYRDGDIIVVSPTASLRRGDRVVLKTKDGEVLAKQLARETATRVELKSINPDHQDRSFQKSEIAWMARIVWVSQ